MVKWIKHTLTMGFHVIFCSLFTELILSSCQIHQNQPFLHIYKYIMVGWKVYMRSYLLSMTFWQVKHKALQHDGSYEPERGLCWKISLTFMNISADPPIMNYTNNTSVDVYANMYTYTMSFYTCVCMYNKYNEFYNYSIILMEWFFFMLILFFLVVF